MPVSHPQEPSLEELQELVRDRARHQILVHYLQVRQAQTGLLLFEDAAKPEALEHRGRMKGFQEIIDLPEEIERRVKASQEAAQVVERSEKDDGF